jgi:ATP-binding cassette subfamily F protein 3
VCDEFWLVSRGGVEPFDGDLDDYQRYLLEEGKRLRESLKAADRAAESPKPAPPPVVAKRTVPSGKLKPLRQALEKLDKSMAALQTEKVALEARLAAALSVDEITQTGNQLQHVNDELAREEEKWLELSGQIEVQEAEGA